MYVHFVCCLLSNYIFNKCKLALSAQYLFIHKALMEHIYNNMTGVPAQPAEVVAFLDDYKALMQRQQAGASDALLQPMQPQQPQAQQL